MIHSRAWLLWLAAVLAALGLSHNPFYLLLILLVVLVVNAAIRQSPSSGRSAGLPTLQFTALVILTASVFNALTSHFGATKLFTIPGRVPLISGQVTLEALIFGATNGLVLGGIFSAFTTLNQALPVRALIRLIPPAFYPLALVSSIAITFFPTTLRRAEEIRQAQAIRGHRVRTLKDWLPLFMPLLVDSLERALQLAESMTARGFASQPAGSPQGTTLAADWQRPALLLGLILLLAGWLLPWVGISTLLGRVLMGLGAAAILGAFWWVNRCSTRTIYQPEPWRRPAGLVILGALLTLCAFCLPFPGFDFQTLQYSPYPQFHLPGFDPLIGTLTFGLLVPAFFVGEEPV